MASQISNSSSRGGSKTSIQPNFADPNFDPADFLNASLSPLTVASSQPNASRTQGSVPLTELSTQVQSLLSQISAQNIRLSSTLSQLTDEILRSGGRLAYEVEVLRGETIGLSETLTEVLRDDIARFIPEPSERKPEQVENAPEDDIEITDQPAPTVSTDPEYVTNLRTLNQVRSRLEEVVQTFGDAMGWPLPPSELSFSSSFISVSGPDLGEDGQDREEKGQEMMKNLRAEVTGLLDSEGGGRNGLEAADRRVEALRTLAKVWNSSAEEKARNRFVDSLAKIVDDRRRSLDQAADQSQRTSSRSRPEARRDSDSGAPAGGLFRNLQRLREEIYLE
ncbi:unnamed protein product [Penicillium salamii]|uniref:Uncharacterized protein n=1 Tax=Penicillium salamii TaxID=1612424 RepID=A0A9W4NL49_9EURO|nr:unnamed protein product [Penicillium salamii]CAG8238393.1 unnamed protein product [Penicillium salamii]CAG8247375.1 unnamed protein product [Penicillium salamii]CAG8260440.1 unnamed protein product [Penicillium salamii]CAG8269162.1 unnamed protein product [Penicillium salamii]